MLLLLFIIPTFVFSLLQPYTQWTCNKCILEHKPYTLYDAKQKLSLSNYIQGSSGYSGWTINTVLPSIYVKNPVCVLQFTASTVVGNFSETNINLNTPFVVVDSLVYIPLLLHYAKQIVKGGIMRFNAPLTQMRYINNHTLAPDHITTLTHIGISGDWTRGYEVIAFDDVRVYC